MTDCTSSKLPTPLLPKVPNVFLYISSITRGACFRDDILTPPTREAVKTAKHSHQILFDRSPHTLIYMNCDV